MAALLAGATVNLRVVSTRDGQPIEGVRVTAIRAHELATTRDEPPDDSVATVTTDNEGIARISGLPREELVFLLDAPGRAHPQVSGRYRFEPGTVTDVDDLTLEPAANVYVTVAANPSLQDKLELHEVQLRPAGDNPWPANAPLRATIAGKNAAIADVPPGAWIAEARGRLKSGFAIRTASTRIDVAPGVDRAVTLTIADTLFRGRVVRGGEPVAGSINLKPAERGTTRSAVATLAADGSFEVLLERAGSYKAYVQDTSGASTSPNRHIAFGDPSDEVTIELPDGEIRGRVLDARGAPVAALVSGTQRIAEPAGAVFTRTAVNGEFVLRGASAGTWEVTASTPHGASEPLIVAVDRGDVDGVELMIHPIRTIAVRVLDTTGMPMRDVLVNAQLPREQARMTNAEGVATFRVAPEQQAKPTNLVVATMDVRLSCALRRLDSHQTLTVPPASGEVRLVGLPPGRDIAQRWLVSATGCAVPFLGTRAEQERGGERALVFRRLAAGTWTYVETRTPAEQMAVLSGEGLHLPAVKTFTVSAGGVTRVTFESGAVAP